MTPEDDFAEKLAAATPTPGGGAAAARVGLYACSLLRMVTGITLEKIASGKVNASAGTSDLQASADAARELGKRFEALEIEDMAAFQAFLTALRLPRGTDEEKEERSRARREAAARATEAPLATLEASRDVLSLCGQLQELSKTTALRAESDLAAAVELANAAYRVAELNIRVNLPELVPEEGDAARKRWQELGSSLDTLYLELRKDLEEK